MPEPESRVGVLLSGGLDSSILVSHLLAQGHRVVPFYVRSGLYWQRDEFAAARRYLAAIASAWLEPLITFEVPLADLYGDHWSITGRSVPGADTADEAVYLPGRNALLSMKPALWCQLHAIPQLALGPLGTSPFPDASEEFFRLFQRTLTLACARPLEICCPFATMDKRQVMQLGKHCPLELTFSCIAPTGGVHCGDCNKCIERQGAFRLASRTDPTVYAK